MRLVRCSIRVESAALRLVCECVDRAQMRSGTWCVWSASSVRVGSLSLESANSVVYSQGEATRQRLLPFGAWVLMRRVWG